jgi:hypothetical protein
MRKGVTLFMACLLSVGEAFGAVAGVAGLLLTGDGIAVADPDDSELAEPLALLLWTTRWPGAMAAITRGSRP